MLDVPTDFASPPALVVAIVSGKGGTGKSTLAVNLAEAAAEAGHAVALLDADPCQHACATLMNEEPAASVMAVSHGAVAPERAAHRAGNGVTLVVGGTMSRPGGLPPAFFDALDEALDAAAWTHDLVLIDAPAGLDASVRWALDRAGVGLLVLVGEPTSVTGAYALLKTTWQAVPDYPFLTVVNAADTEADAAQTAERFTELTAQFLGQSPRPLGWLPYDAQVRGAARDQTPAIRQSAGLRAAIDGLLVGLAPLLPVRERA